MGPWKVEALNPILVGPGSRPLRASPGDRQGSSPASGVQPKSVCLAEPNGSSDGFRFYE